MRVLHVTPYFAPAFRYGGPPRSVLGLCHGLMEAGVEVEVFTTTADGDGELPDEVAASASFDAVPVRYFKRRFPRRSFGASGLGDALDEALGRFDLVHLNGLWNVPVWLAARACMRRGAPFVVSPRGMLDPGSVAHRRLRKAVCYGLWERRYLKRAAWVHATSDHEAGSVERLGLGRPIVCLPNGVTPPCPPSAATRAAHPELSERGVDSSQRLVVFLGRLHPTKRLELFLEAVSMARREEPSLRALLVGPPDGLDPEALLSRCGARDFARATGAVDSETRWDLLRSAEALVLCSDSESFGTSVVEAMAVGIPVVVTKTCPWEVVASRRCGFWVEQSAARVAEALVALLRDPEASRAMGRRGRELVDEKYAWTAIGQEMAGRYRSTLEERH